ncbi:MAG TPA: VTT domain-containing protein [Dehalococcoidia bacterium]|jgi:membrane protein DedA with SNARE-associated domain|nr:VTT domain-containing protein [Dehalococcoidia bacterium]
MTVPTPIAEHEHHPVGVEREGLFIHLGRRRVRLEYLLLATMLIFACSLAALFFALDLGKGDVQRWGYAGLFGIVLLRSASVVLPMPGGGVIFAGGGLLDPVLGVPAPIAVGLVAGFAESLGELTGYGAGMGGSQMLKDRTVYRRIKRWVEKRPFQTVFLMTFTPPVLFDVAGLAAGAARVPLRVFYPALLSGKILRDTLVATAGFYSFGIVEDWYAEAWDGVVEGISWVAGLPGGLV